MVSVPTSGEFSLNEMAVTIATSLPVNTAGLTVVLVVSVETVWNSGSYDGGTNRVLVLHPDANGRCRFFINEMLHKVFAGQEDVPIGTGQPGTETVCAHTARRYRMTAFERAGDPWTVTDTLQGQLSQDRVVFRGGIPVAERTARPWTGANGWWNSILGRPFYDHRGPTVRTGPEQHQWLYWRSTPIYVPALPPLPPLPIPIPIIDHYRQMEVVFESGQVHVVSDLLLTNIATDDVYMLPAGRLQLGLDFLEQGFQSKVLRYTIWLTAGAGGIPVSERKTFEVDWQYYEFVTELAYRNAMGTMTQLALRGRPVRDTDADRRESYNRYDRSQAAHRGVTHGHGTVVRNGRNVASGYLMAAEMRQMGELAASDMVMVRDAQRGWVRVRMGKISHADDRLNTARRIDVEFHPAFSGPIADVMR